MVEDAEGQPTWRHVRAGDMTYIPDGVYHGHGEHRRGSRCGCWRSTPPGGPEAILRELPDCVIVPPGELPAR